MINKFFSWDFIVLDMSNRDIELMSRIYKMKLSDVLDYLVVLKQYDSVEKLKSNKNSIAI